MSFRGTTTTAIGFPSEMLNFVLLVSECFPRLRQVLFCFVVAVSFVSFRNETYRGTAKVMERKKKKNICIELR